MHGTLLSCPARFLEECGHDLLTLRLACCKYVGKNCLATIGRVCTKLEGVVQWAGLHYQGASGHSLIPGCNLVFVCLFVCVFACFVVFVCLFVG